MEDVTNTVTFDVHNEALNTFPTESEMDLYILLHQNGATQTRKQATQLFKILKSFTKDDWKMFNTLQVHGITKTRKLISKIQKEINEEKKEQDELNERELNSIDV